MSQGPILVFLIITLILGGCSRRFGGYGYGFGNAGVGLLGAELVAVVLLMYLGKI